MRSKIKLLEKKIQNYFFWKKLKKVLPDNPKIIEAGAHNGLDSVRMAKFWPRGTVYAFEPIPEIFLTLEKNTADYTNIKIYRKALSDKNGSQEIHISSGRSDASSSLLVPKKHLEVHPDVFFNTQSTVECINLNEFSKMEGLSVIDFLWLDIQGMELPVLKAGLNVLKNTKGIFMEVNFIENYAGCCLYDETKDWLKSQNFYIAWKGKQYKDAGNVLFLKKEL